MRLGQRSSGYTRAWHLPPGGPGIPHSMRSNRDKTWTCCRQTGSRDPLSAVLPLLHARKFRRLALGSYRRFKPSRRRQAVYLLAGRSFVYGFARHCLCVRNFKSKGDLHGRSKGGIFLTARENALRPIARPQTRRTSRSLTVVVADPINRILNSLIEGPKGVWGSIPNGWPCESRALVPFSRPRHRRIDHARSTDTAFQAQSWVGHP